MFDNLILGLMAALQWKQFLFMVAGTVIGLWVGVLPGLGGPVAMAILIPFTFTMDPLSALLMLASISVGAAFGGSITSILLNIPGEASSAATAYDGYPMAQQGKAKVAMGLSAGASMVAGIVGVLILMFVSGPVTKVALAFSPAEYFALAILGLTVVSVAALGSTVKGLAMGAFGIAISLIGVDSILGTERYTFGYVYLLDGISFVPVMVGLFAITELITMIIEGGTIAKSGKLQGSLWDGFIGTFKYPFALTQSTMLGAFIGIIPGLGATAANFLAYSVAKRTSKHPEQFGKGAPEGVIAPEASNNSCIPTSLIPALTLGIPGGATAAILLVAVTVQGLRPGPMLFTSNPELIWGFYMGLLIGCIMATILYLIMIPWFALVTLVRIELMAPILLIITLFGAYANERNMMDVFVAIGFGLFGYFARRHGYPLISLVIGLILGKLAEGAFHQALQISNHDYSVFVLRPLSATIFAICIVLVLWPGVKKRVGKGGAEVT
ncbi:MAG: tripartite tricarboxylate transporter permease [Xanthobacteraceae bacterium]|nr:tripartite tricarboxylate transporter permease [Xanthobacteraceae bacterium]